MDTCLEALSPEQARRHKGIPVHGKGAPHRVGCREVATMGDDGHEWGLTGMLAGLGRSKSLHHVRVVPAAGQLPPEGTCIHSD